MHIRKSTAAALLAVFGLSAGHMVSANADESRIPDTGWPTQSWPTSTAEEQGMDSASLARLIETVGTFRQDSLMIIRHGRVVAEAYYAPYVAGVSHDLRSVTKSVTGTLTAIEIKKGLLDSVDHPVVDLFSDHEIANVDDNEKKMTVKHLLDMTSGIAWTERFYTPNETIMQMYRAPNRTEFVLNQPMSNPPGDKFYYDSGNPYLLSALITKKTGQSAFEFAKQALFEPLGISSAKWGGVDAQGVTDGEAGLSLTPEDMARIGYLYLHNGIWDGKEIIPSSWVERAKAGQVQATFGNHYANLWWSRPEKGAFMALGRHSQMILVIPRLDIVVTMTGILRDDEFYPLVRLIDDVTKSAKSDGSLPADPVAQSLLAAAIRTAATEKPSAVTPAPDQAKDVSGRSFRFADNDLHVKTFKLNLFDDEPSWEITTETGKDHSIQRFSGLMGLDGVYRRSPPAFYGINAVKGRWINQHSFQVDRRILGHSETQRWTLAFEGDKVEVSFENTDGFKTQLHGERAD
jgi:CubicO group peptidase (beta-lactamase class C family)